MIHFFFLRFTRENSIKFGVVCLFVVIFLWMVLTLIIIFAPWRLNLTSMVLTRVLLLTSVFSATLYPVSFNPTGTAYITECWTLTWLVVFTASLACLSSFFLLLHPTSNFLNFLPAQVAEFVCLLLSKLHVSCPLLIFLPVNNLGAFHIAYF